MFTRLLVGLDQSPQADAALEQAVILGRRFRSTILVASVEDRVLAERGSFRVEAGGLSGQPLAPDGAVATVLANLARDVDATLIGRRGSASPQTALGAVAASLIRLAERPVVVCGPVATPMRSCAVAWDGRNTRALQLAGRFASVVGSTVHVIHANNDHAAGVATLGGAEVALSLLGVSFVSHVEPGEPADAVARVVRECRADALFAGAHLPRTRYGEPSIASHTEGILTHTDIPVVIQP
jgi:nucleotide-binding universal stress UspA family protein